MEEDAPNVFISYSHDSPSHKQWVAELAARLRGDGIDAVLDQWDLSPGDDVTKFMEDGLGQSDRVLVICTEPYVRKADAGEGGVGYERMIVTAELVRNLGTQKFIPVIRQKAEMPALPKFLGYRLYVDLSREENHEDQYEVLLRELHKQPAIHKPPLGTNPFAGEGQAERDTQAAQGILPLERVDANGRGAADVYRLALDIARRQDLVAWRKLVKSVRRSVNACLAKWRIEGERTILSNHEKALEVAWEGVLVCAPLFAVALAGVESMGDVFTDQRGVVDYLLNPAGWRREGLVWMTEFPETLAFVFQAVHGAVCLDTRQLHVALDVAKMQMPDSHGAETRMLLRCHQIIGWPKSLGGKSTVAWEFLTGAYGRVEWMNEIFATDREFRVALCAYYLALQVLELAELIARGREDVLAQERFDDRSVPLCFLSERDDIPQEAYRLLLRSRPEVAWESLGVSRPKMAEHWPRWMEHSAAWLAAVYEPHFLIRMVHQGLFDDVSA